MIPDSQELIIFPEQKQWVEGTASWIRDTIRNRMETNGSCTIALSGGRTPRAIYRRLAEPPFRDQILWERLHVFWGDERAVGPEHADSNYRMARETLLDHVPIPVRNIHRIKGELPPETAVGNYVRELEEHFSKTGTGKPVFDLALLGLNVDGHIASLFPRNELLTDCDRRWAASTYVPRLNSWRITLTPRTFNHALNIAFLVFGEKKAEIIHRVFEGPDDPIRYPAQLIQPENGRVYWLLDRTAAYRLPEQEQQAR